MLKMKLQPTGKVSTGDVGYIISGIKRAVEVKVGDTITHSARPCAAAIAGFEEVKPMVFAGMYPVQADKFEELRATLEKFQLNDASFVYEPESSLALGFGFRCGFLGLLHLEIVQERLFREFNMDVITTVPNVSYKVYTTQGRCLTCTIRPAFGPYADRSHRGAFHQGPDHLQDGFLRGDYETVHGQEGNTDRGALHHFRQGRAHL